MKGLNIVLILTLLALSGCSVSAKDRLLNVKEHGVTGDGVTDDLKAIQRCIDLASAQNIICYFPDGVYLMKGSLYLVSNLKLKGQKKSVLKFIGGGILGEKSKQRRDYYTNNYNNEFVPNQKSSKILGVSSNRILAANSQVFVVNDDVVIFNGIKNSWEILENKEKSALWNTDDLDEMARGGSFKISAISKNELSTTPNLEFKTSSKSMISKRAGVVNVLITDLTIVSNEVNYTIQLEQPRNVILSNLILKGNGGVLLSQFANNCKILSCDINTTKNASVIIENFSSGNTVNGNRISYLKGKTFQSGSDAAIIVMMASYNNEISNNFVKCSGVRETDEGGIFVHALSHDNVVFDNKVTGASEGIGIYYGAYNNKFSNNQIQGVRVGIMSYYARQSVFEANSIVVDSSRPGNKVGLLSFASNRNNYIKNKISGKMTFGVLLQSSNDTLSSNEFTGPDKTVYAVGLKIIGDKSKTNKFLNSNNFTDFKIESQ